MVDVLYILGRGSKHNDDELRYSLRSLDKYGKNIGRVFICGNCPEWVQNVVHIHCEDTYQPAQNCAVKVSKACETDISEVFLLMNDDFIIMEEFDADTYPYFNRGIIQYTVDNPTLYQQVNNKTFDWLLARNMPRLNYGVHCPMRMSKEKVKYVMPIIKPVLTEKVGYAFRSIIGNIFHLKSEETKDTKCNNDEPVPATETKCYSLADNCENMLKMCAEWFPNKSRWEK